MDGRKLQDRLYLGSGLAARHVGQTTEAFRPNGPSKPLDTQNRFLRLPATFLSLSSNDRRTNVYGEALWHGVFDASYTRPSDYLVQTSGIFFVASQAPLLPVLCVKTNRNISIVRPNMATNSSSSAYGGYTSGSSTILMEGWPASVLGENRSSASTTHLPTDQAVPYWNILLPRLANVNLAPGDLITDDLNRTAVVTGSELTDLGWRINAKLATT